MPIFSNLSTPRLLLRRIIPDDLHHIYQGLSDPQVIQYYGVSYRTPEETQLQMDWYAHLEASGSGHWWAICSQEDKTFMGASGLNNLQQIHRKTELGFWLLPAYWGRGFAHEAVSAILEYAFQTLGLHRVEAQVEPENEACKRLLTHLHFSYEGTWRDCEMKNGRFISLEHYALLEDKLARIDTDG